MPLAHRVKPQIGDVIEIPTPSGFAYAHYTHKHEEPPKYGSLLRVLPGLHESRPVDFADLVKLQPQFITFFPLGAACKQKIVHVVANEPIPTHAQSFPTFRSCVRTPSGRGPWWLWDGKKEWKIGALKPGMEFLPLRAVWNDTMLVERIIQEWRHECDT